MTFGKRDKGEKKSVFTDPFTETPLYSVFVYGDNRSGKTSFCATAADVPGWKVLYIDADGGWVTLKQFPNWEPEKGIGDLYVVKATNLLDELEKVANIISKGGYDLVIFDTFSNFMNNTMIDITGGHKAANYHWNELFTSCLKFVLHLRSLNQRILFTAFPRYLKDAQGNVVGVKPLLYGNDFPNYLLTPFNTICILDVESKKKGVNKEVEQTFTLSGVQTGEQVIGDRFHKIKKMESPTVDRVFKLIEGRE